MDCEWYEFEFYSCCDFYVSCKWLKCKENKWKIWKGIFY